MRQFSIILIINFLIFSQYIYTQEEITLNECFELALKNNIDIKVKEYLPDIAQAEILLAKSPYDIFVFSNYEYGKIDSRIYQGKNGIFSIGIAKRFLTGTIVSLKYSVEYRRDSDIDTLRDLNNMAAQNDPSAYDEDLDIKKLYTSGVTIELTQPLLRNFGIEVNKAFIEAAKRNKKASEYEYQMEVNDILSKVESAYWSWIYTLKNKEILKISIKKAKEFRELVKKKSGKIEGVLPSDVNDANINIYKREDLYIQSERNCKIAKDRLVRLILSYSPDNPEKIKWNKIDSPSKDYIKDFIIPFSFEKLKNKEDNLEEFLPNPKYKDAIKYRPEIKIIKEKLKALEYIKYQAKNSLLPSLDVYGGVSFLGEKEEGWDAFKNGFDGDHYKWNVGISLEIPLGNLNAKSKLKKASKQYKQVETMLYQTQYNICLEIREALHKVEEAIKRYIKAEKSYINAVEMLKRLEKRYHNPLKGDFNLIFFLQDAEFKRTEASLLKNKAILDYKLALVELKKAQAFYIKEIYNKNKNK